MLTQIVTFLILFAIIGCILYGRRLIRTEKVDAVFGNPERALGGTHWVIVGSSFLIFVWLYYSWDIAKGFYPKSANELCQVAKVCLLYTSPSPRDQRGSRMPSSA